MMNTPVAMPAAIRRISSDVRALAASGDPVIRARSPYAEGRGARLPMGDGTGFVDYVYISDDLFLLGGKGAPETDLEEVFVGEGHLKFNFHLSGRSHIQLGSDEPMANDGLNGGILIQPVGTAKREVTRAGTPHEYLTIICGPELLPRLFEDHIGKLPTPIQAFARSLPVSYGGQFRPTPDMVSRVRSLLNSAYSGTLRSVQTEAVALELLCATLHLLAGGSEGDTAPRLRSRDITLLQEGADIISREHTNPPTLEQLARRLGINQNKLTQGFRRQFGMTVAQYCQAQRMNEAARLLKDDALTIYRVSELVGYEFPGNFTAAFKRHFGVSPKSFRR